MDGRKYQRKSGIRRTLVMLLALVMLASVCFPAMRVDAEETSNAPGENIVEEIKVGDKVVKDEEVKDEEVKDEEVKDEEAKDEEVKDEEAKDEEAKDEEVKDEEAKDEEVKDEEAKDEEAEDKELVEEQPVENAPSTVHSETNGLTFTVTGNLPEAVALQAVKIDSDVFEFIQTEVLQSDSVEIFAAYDISLLLNGEEVQPNGPVEVTIQGIDPADAVYHLKDTSAKDIYAAHRASTELVSLFSRRNTAAVDAIVAEQLSSSYEENALKFTTDGFSAVLFGHYKPGDPKPYADDEPDKVFIQVQKTFENLTEAQLDALRANTENPFTITVSNKDNNVSRTLTLNDNDVTSSGFTFTWKLSGLSVGTYTVSETNADVEGYELESEGLGTSIETEPASATFNMIKRETSCTNNAHKPHDTIWDIGTNVGYVVVKLTNNAGYFVWTANTLSSSQRQAIIKHINTIEGFSNPNEGNCTFFSGDKLTDADGLFFRGGHIRYDKETGNINFYEADQWSMFAYGTCEIDENETEISVKNTYTPKTTPITVTKIVTGNMGDWNLLFDFDAKFVKADGTVVLIDGETYEGDFIDFDLKHNGVKDFQSAPLSTTLWIKENGAADTYKTTVTYTVNDGDPVTVSPENGWYKIPVVAGLAVTFTNHKDVPIDTGITTDSLPYIILFSMAVIGAGALLLNKRRMF